MSDSVPEEAVELADEDALLLAGAEARAARDTGKRHSDRADRWRDADGHPFANYEFF